MLSALVIVVRPGCPVDITCSIIFRERKARLRTVMTFQSSDRPRRNFQLRCIASRGLLGLPATTPMSDMSPGISNISYTEPPQILHTRAL